MFAGVLALWSVPAFSDAFQSMANQRNNLPGSRAALMGGAFTAVADDSSASFYNPAGLAKIKENRLELSATSYRSSSLVYHETVNEEPFREKSDVIYPSFVGGTSRFGWLTLGYSFMTLDARNIYQQDKYDNISTVDGVANSYSRTYQESSTYIWAGASAAIRLTDSLSFGSSVFYYQRNIEFTSNEIITMNGGDILSVNETLKTLNTGAASVNGLHWRGETLSLGLAVKMASAYSDNSTLYLDRLEYADVDDDGEEEPSKTSTTHNHKALNELNPTTYNAGVAWKPFTWWTLSADVHIHEGVRSPWKSRGGHDLHTTADYSVGTALGGQAFGLMAGYFTNNSMFREPDPAYAGQPLWINYIGRSFGLSWMLSGFHGQMGYIEQIGTGKAQIRSGDPDVQRVDGNVRTWIVGGKVPL
jgi:long-chain fatty acid transport protein